MVSEFRTSLTDEPRPHRVRQVGIEPTRPFGHRVLNPARLPDSATGAWRCQRYRSERR